MIDNIIVDKFDINQPSNNVLLLVEKKLEFFRNVMQKTIIHVQQNKNLGILELNDINVCIDKICKLHKKIEKIEKIDTHNTLTNTINSLQIINNELSCILKNYGTESFDDLLLICFGNDAKISNNETEHNKLEILKKYFHPTGYKIINKKDGLKNKDEVENKYTNLYCSDVVESYKQLDMKVHGIKIYIESIPVKRSLVIFGTMDNVVVDFLNDKFMLNKLKQIREKILAEHNNNKLMEAENFMESLMLRDLLIYETNNIYNNFHGMITRLNLIKHQHTTQVIKDFMSDDIYIKRNTLITLLINSHNYENQYLAYLLYDLISNDANSNVDTLEQTNLFNSFPWSIKCLFKQAINKTIEYTHQISNFDINKIPMEQQICLLNAPDLVKEKAMAKLKELKSKTDDSGSKARQYLDGLLKIPFGFNTREPILNVMGLVKNKFKNLHKKYHIDKIIPEIVFKETYSSIEIIQHLKKIKCQNILNTNACQLEKIKDYFKIGDKKKLSENLKLMNSILTKYNKPISKCSNLNKNDMINYLINIIDLCIEEDDYDDEDDTDHQINVKIIADILLKFNSVTDIIMINHDELNGDMDEINTHMKSITNYITDVNKALDNSIHGHIKAKKQIERIIGQWINGEQYGYCFGFEGPPGVGKTTLAKYGLANCLKDEKGNSRPFAMIQIGGDSNGSSLHGHNYTYVGSSWGSIVQILIDKKCMNPIIFIDEVDKISRTENGKEIIGILTHLLDPTQNDCFQDKYFTSIDLDLSKALFILSYNDVEAIDKILLDRIHRIKFNNLSLEDKVIICNTHILPDIYKKMGLDGGIVHFNDEVLKHIIDEYTCEAGVRKLKEFLFEIVGEINLDILKNNESNYTLPINISIPDIKLKYCKDKHEIKHKKIHTENTVGIINGLWANALGKGGVIPIQTSWRPSDKFLSLHLTGMQGEVMKESMNVALTLAWDLTSFSRKKEVRDEHSLPTNINGVHIHCPEGATPKDGPSAGTAITTSIYSILNNKKIKHDIAITGEICLNGNVTEIGGLDLKILGAIKAGVKEIIFPAENKKDYTTFMEKYKDSLLTEGIKFHPVNKIQEVFELVFE